MPSAMYVRSKELLLIAQGIRNLDMRLAMAVQQLKGESAPSQSSASDEKRERS